ncbi:MAG: hypothetical protein E6K80_13800 [Candidatus Eisenbacteria bacterium]|uniref:MFS transporter n=1 Tax=Eiseniibacteriota bacterium TaxID=2212470 RepID=A0A538TYT2_UNCEI|nr:MAG: hypothetical protein E6K80_13800 [Candidatus Eisenbacteria bacterium]
MRRLMLYSLVAFLMVASEPGVAALADLLPADSGASGALAVAIGWLTSGANASMTLPVLPGH